MNTASIPLVELEPDESINARRTKSDEGIAELKASILAHGLIQALRVRHDDATGKKKIIAGNRRYRVLCELAADGEYIDGVRVDDAYPVPVIFGDVDDTTARELSQAENFIRLPQHEADTYETFRELADRGLDEGQIAGRFGVDPKRVRRMLALGRLSPIILEAWRAGEFEAHGRAADVVRAFTLAPSIEEQERIYRKLSNERNLHGHAIRRAFGGGDQEAAKHIKIAGLDAYEAAGGRVTRDLFGDEHIIADKDIALRVAEETIKAKLEGLKAEGWSWVSYAHDLPYGWTYGWTKLKPGDGKATADEKKQIKKLEKAVAKGVDGAADELAALQKSIADRIWTPEQLEKSGAVLQVGHYGDVEIVRGVVKPEAPKKAASSSGSKEKSAPTISNAMMHRLSIQVTQAAQKALTDEPRIGLVALLAGFFTYSDGPVRVHTTGMGGGYGEREQFASAFTRLQSMTDEELFRVAAGIAGRALDLQSQNALRAPLSGGAELLAAAIDADRMTDALREHFDAQDYFGSVAKPFVIQAIREAINDDEARKAGKKNKAELAAYAVANIPPTGWLPPEMRCATYSGPTLQVDAPPLDADPNIDENAHLDDDEDDLEAAE